MVRKIVGIICLVLILGTNIGLSSVMAIENNTVFLEQNNEIEPNTVTEQDNETIEDENSIIDSNENEDETENSDEKEREIDQILGFYNFDNDIEERIGKNVVNEEIPKQEEVLKIQKQNIETPTQTIKDGTYIIYTGVGANTCLDVTGGGLRKLY